MPLIHYDEGYATHPWYATRVRPYSTVLHAIPRVHGLHIRLIDIRNFKARQILKKKRKPPYLPTMFPDHPDLDRGPINVRVAYPLINRQRVRVIDIRQADQRRTTYKERKKDTLVTFFPDHP